MTYRIILSSVIIIYLVIASSCYNYWHHISWYLYDKRSRYNVIERIPCKEITSAINPPHGATCDLPSISISLPTNIFESPKDRLVLFTHSGHELSLYDATSSTLSKGESFQEYVDLANNHSGKPQLIRSFPHLRSVALNTSYSDYSISMSPEDLAWFEHCMELRIAMFDTCDKENGVDLIQRSDLDIMIKYKGNRCTVEWHDISSSRGGLIYLKSRHGNIDKELVREISHSIRIKHSQ